MHMVCRSFAVFKTVTVLDLEACFVLEEIEN